MPSISIGQYISNLRVSGVLFIFILFHIEIPAACNRGLHGLSRSQKRYARLIWVNTAAKVLPENVSDSASLKILFEPRHDKTNKMSVRPAKTQISLDIRPI